MLRCKLRGLLHVLPPSCATNFYVARSRRHFLQHENLLRKKVVIRATNHLNLQRNVVARQVAPKCCPHYWALRSVSYSVTARMILLTVYFQRAREIRLPLFVSFTINISSLFLRVIKTSFSLHNKKMQSECLLE